MHHTLPQTPSPSRSRSLVARLHDEWASMRTRPSLLRHAAEWGIVPDPGSAGTAGARRALTTLDDLLLCTGYRPARKETVADAGPSDVVEFEVRNTDVAMARLLLVARTDQLAARVVLQRLLPGLVSVARRWPARREGGSTEPFDDLVGAAWSVIREYPLERRPHHLIANLLRDCEYHAFIRPRRRLLVHESTAPHLFDRPGALTERLDPFDPHDPHDQREPLHELLHIAAHARSLTDEDRRLLGLLLSGRTTVEVASALKVSERTVRTYRAAMVERLRQGIDVLADVLAA